MVAAQTRGTVSFVPARPPLLLSPKHAYLEFTPGTSLRINNCMVPEPSCLATTLLGWAERVSEESKSGKSRRESDPGGTQLGRWGGLAGHLPGMLLSYTARAVYALSYVRYRVVRADLQYTRARVGSGDTLKVSKFGWGSVSG